MGPAAHFGHHEGFQCLRQLDYAARCLPWGYTRAMQTAYPIEIMQTPKRLAILFESNNVFHMVPTDGRKLPENSVI